MDPGQGEPTEIARNARLQPAIEALPARLDRTEEAVALRLEAIEPVIQDCIQAEGTSVEEVESAAAAVREDAFTFEIVKREGVEFRAGKFAAEVVDTPVGTVAEPETHTDCQAAGRQLHAVHLGHGTAGTRTGCGEHTEHRDCATPDSRQQPIPGHATAPKTILLTRTGTPPACFVHTRGRGRPCGWASLK